MVNGSSTTVQRRLGAALSAKVNEDETNGLIEVQVRKPKMGCGMDKEA
jgi:hypothetical protein